jgi:CDP-glucose 4,6-dehydratase
MVTFGDFYAGRRVFVTGHTGFKGAWLTLWLLDLGAHVTGYALVPPTEPSLFATIALDSYEPESDAAGQTGFAGTLTDLRGDVRDREALARALAQAAPEVVFHLAAQPLVRRSYAEPHLTYETNVMGTVNLLEAVRSLTATGHGPRAVVNVTSDKCYQNREVVSAYVESDPLGGWDPYSSSKACAELVTQAYRHSFFSQPGAPWVATARAGNVIGGGDWGDDRIVPDCARAVAADRPVEVRNQGAVRPWQHVLESLSGYLWLAAQTPADGAWNFGPAADAQVTVREVVELFLAAWGDGEWRPAPGAAEQPHEAGLLVLDAGKADRELGWRPAWSATQAVKAAAHWYREFYTDAEPGQLLARCRADIADYSAAAAARAAAWTTARATA